MIRMKLIMPVISIMEKRFMHLQALIGGNIDIVL